MDLRRIRNLRALRARFARSYVKCQSSGCWNWIRAELAVNVRFTTGRRIVRATHLSLALAGRRHERGTPVTRTCGNDRCVNPDHIAWHGGAHWMQSWHRRNPGQVWTQPRAPRPPRVPPEVVAQLVAAPTYRGVLIDLSEQFGLPRSTIANIRTAHRRAQGAVQITRKLSEADVRHIRSLPPERGLQARLAREYGVRESTIHHVLRGTSWAEVA